MREFKTNEDRENSKQSKHDDQERIQDKVKLTGMNLKQSQYTFSIT